MYLTPEYIDKISIRLLNSKMTLEFYNLENLLGTNGKIIITNLKFLIKLLIQIMNILMKSI